MPFVNFMTSVPLLTFALPVCQLGLIQQIRINGDIFTLHILVCRLVCLVGKKMMISQDQSCLQIPTPENINYVTPVQKKE
jgi:hypothetical protein